MNTTTLYLKNSFGLWCTSSPRKVKKVNSLDLLKPAKIMNIFMKRGRDKKNIAYNMRGGLLKCLTSLKVFFSSQKWSDFDLGLRSWTANKWSNFNYYSFIWLMTVLYFKDIISTLPKTSNQSQKHAWKGQFRK